MNKFVKGAKNLAFALSFVTVAACGYVKKADLEALDKKINDKFEGVARNGEADSSQGYVRRGDVDSKIANEKKVLVEEITGIKGKMATRENIIDICIKKGGIDFELLKRCGVDLEGRNFSVSLAESKVVIKNGDFIVFEDFKVNSLDEVKFIEGVVSLKGSFVFDEAFSKGGRIKFAKNSSKNLIKVGEYDTTKVEESVELFCLLGKIGEGVFEKFFDRGSDLVGTDMLAKTDKKIFDQDFVGIKDVLEEGFYKREEVCAGLEVLFGKKGRFVIGNGSGTAEEKKISVGKWGFVFNDKVGNVEAIQFEAD